MTYLVIVCLIIIILENQPLKCTLSSFNLHIEGLESCLEKGSTFDSHRNYIYTSKWLLILGILKWPILLELVFFLNQNNSFKNGNTRPHCANNFAYPSPILNDFKKLLPKISDIVFVRCILILLLQLSHTKTQKRKKTKSHRSIRPKKVVALHLARKGQNAKMPLKGVKWSREDAASLRTSRVGDRDRTSLMFEPFFEPELSLSL